MQEILKAPDEEALFYRTGHLTTIPDSAGGPSHPVVETMFISRHGDILIKTIPDVRLGGPHNVVCKGLIQTLKCHDARVATARFRSLVEVARDQPYDGWRAADITQYQPGDPSSLRPLPPTPQKAQ